MTSPESFDDCLKLKKEKAKEESDLSDVLSSDSDESSLDELGTKLEQEQKKEKKSTPQKQSRTKREEELERMFFYSIYVDHHMPRKEKQTVIPLESEGFDKRQVYDENTKKALYKKASRFVIDEIDEKEFSKVLKTYIVEDEGIEDIEGNISIKTMSNRNFETLRMDGPSRRVALLFSYQPDERPISFSFLHFMQMQKEKNPYLTGVLLYYGTGIGVHIVEGSEYVLLMHFPLFFKSESFKKLKSCKVLAVEDLSPMKYFEHYSSYKGNPPELPDLELPEEDANYSTAFPYISQIGTGLQIFLQHVYQDFPNATEDNDLPESVNNLLPQQEIMEFILGDKWKPGLRDVKTWYHKLTSSLGEMDNAEFVWPPRSDMMPVYVLHPTPEENEFFINETKRKLKGAKFEET